MNAGNTPQHLFPITNKNMFKKFACGGAIPSFSSFLSAILVCAYACVHVSEGRGSPLAKCCSSIIIKNIPFLVDF